jgi:rod shape-determining protein MreD
VTPGNWARLILVAVIGLVLQVGVLNGITLFGAHPDVMVVIAACAGMAAGPERGMVAGFVTGLFADLVVNLPFGLSSLTFVLIGFSTGLIRETVVARDIGGAQVTACVAAAGAGAVLYAIIGAIAGQPGMLGLATAQALLSVTLGAVILAYPTLAAARWAFAGTRETIGLAVPRGGSAAG